MIKENVQVVDATPMQPTKGSAGLTTLNRLKPGNSSLFDCSRGTAGLKTQLAGQATTVSNVSAATGGIGRGKFVMRDTK